MPVPKRNPQSARKESAKQEEAPPPPPAPEADDQEIPDLPAPDDNSDSGNEVPDAPPALPAPQASTAQAQQEAEPDHAMVAALVEAEKNDSAPTSPSQSPAKQSEPSQASPELRKEANPPSKPVPGLQLQVSQAAQAQKVDDRRGSQGSTASAARDDDLKVAEHMAKTRGKPPDIKPREVAAFLKPLGYEAADDKRWSKPKDQQPNVTITVNNHIEFGDHTQYEFICKAVPPAGSGMEETSWRTLRRLKHIRSGLHDPVRKALGSQYKTYFGETPFALHTAPPGTTQRLKNWFTSLANCINKNGLDPMHVAISFRLLDAPGTPLHAEGKYSFCLNSDFDQIPVTAAMFGTKHNVANPEISKREVQTPRGGSAGARSTPSNGNAGYTAGASGSKPGGEARTTADWLLDQDQFSHLPVLPAGWIRVVSRSTGQIYYCCTDTGDTTFEEPTQSRVIATTGGDLPPGWVQMTSRTTGRFYYWNTVTQTSQFERPTA